MRRNAPSEATGTGGPGKVRWAALSQETCTPARTMHSSRGRRAGFSFSIVSISARAGCLGSPPRGCDSGDRGLPACRRPVARAHSGCRAGRGDRRSSSPRRGGPPGPLEKDHYRPLGRVPAVRPRARRSSPGLLPHRLRPGRDRRLRRERGGDPPAASVDPDTRADRGRGSRVGPSGRRRRVQRRGWGDQGRGSAHGGRPAPRAARRDRERAWHGRAADREHEGGSGGGGSRAGGWRSAQRPRHRRGRPVQDLGFIRREHHDSAWCPNGALRPESSGWGRARPHTDRWVPAGRAAGWRLAGTLGRRRRGEWDARGLPRGGWRRGFRSGRGLSVRAAGGGWGRGGTAPEHRCGAPLGVAGGQRSRAPGDTQAARGPGAAGAGAPGQELRAVPVRETGRHALSGLRHVASCGGERRYEPTPVRSARRGALRGSRSVTRSAL